MKRIIYTQLSGRKFVEEKAIFAIGRNDWIWSLKMKLLTAEASCNPLDINPIHQSYNTVVLSPIDTFVHGDQEGFEAGQ